MKYWYYNICILFLCLICFSSVNSLKNRSHKSLPSCRKTVYSYSTLSLTWLGEYCSQYKCSWNWKNLWDKKSFAVHGYWPASTDLAFLSCQKDNGYDQYCYNDYQFKESLLYGMSKDLNRVWPQIGAIKNFWEYQWEKHGTCYMKLILDSYNKANLSKEEIFKKYFSGVIKKFDSLPLNNIIKFNINKKGDLAQILKLKQDQFITVCGKDNELDQIRICYNLAEPQKQTIISCPGKKPVECNYPFVLKQ